MATGQLDGTGRVSTSHPRVQSPAVSGPPLSSFSTRFPLPHSFPGPGLLALRPHQVSVCPGTLQEAVSLPPCCPPLPSHLSDLRSVITCLGNVFPHLHLTWQQPPFLPVLLLAACSHVLMKSSDKYLPPVPDHTLHGAGPRVGILTTVGFPAPGPCLAQSKSLIDNL